MRVPLRWLREYVDISLSAEEIAHQLTMSGTEVGSILRVGAGWERIVVGRVEEIKRHPNADSLFVATVDVGSERITLVTAAPNLHAGDVVPVVRAGGRLGADRVVEARRFRGVASEGMLCSGDELGISADKDTIYVLEPEAPIGIDLRDYLGDDILDIELTPNRPDCLGVVGIAREVAALTGAARRIPQAAAPLGASPIGDHLQVFVDDPDLCPRYTAAYVDGVRVGPSPPWLQRRIHLSGMRAINNVVDVTNYVMLEMGQPLHAFDAARLRDATIRVRRARQGEAMTTIDGERRELLPDMLVIADAREPVALAGIMGGIDSEISDGTTRVALESATFDPRSIRRTSRALRLGSEASKRFDKGLDVELASAASWRALDLIASLAGGTTANGLADVRQPAAERRQIRFTPGDVAGLLGETYSVEQIEGVLRPLGFDVGLEQESLEAIVPTWRGDVEGKADIAEEVARITGYDAIGTALPSGSIPPTFEDPTLRWEETVRSALAAAGLQEVITYSLVDPAAATRLDAAAPDPSGPAPSSASREAEKRDAAIAVANPMSVEHSVLRTTLLPSLFLTVSANLRFGPRACIFEIARVYLPPLDPLPREERRLAIAIAGHRLPEAWSNDPATVDFYDLKAAVEGAFRALHLAPPEIAAGSGTRAPWAHPGRSAAVTATGTDAPLGAMGQVHPRVAERFEIGVELYAAELDLTRLLALAREEVSVSALPRFPAVERDLALVVGDDVSHDELTSTIRSSAGPLLEDLALFDVYRGKPVPDGHRSLAYSLTFRSPERTLADDEVATALDSIEREVAARFGARLRGR